MRYKISKYTHILGEEDEKYFFNAKTLKLFSGNSEDEIYLKNFIDGREVDLDNIRDKDLVENGLIIKDNFDEMEYMKLHRIKRMDYEKKKKNKIGYMRISLTENCNLRCKYCFVNDIYKDKIKSDMSEEKFIEYMEWFIKENTGGNPIIQYFGGEPLLKMNLINIGHQLLEKAKIDKKINGYQEEIVTNGTLLNEEKAEFFISKGIDVCFSIDGWEEINDKNRVFPNGQGSYEMIMKGINAFRNKGGKFKAIITPTNENIEIFHEIIEFFIYELHCCEISVNTPQPNKNGWNIDGSKMAEAIQKAWDICDRNNIPFNAPGTNIVFLVNNRFTQSYSCMNLTYGQDINSYGVYINSSGLVSNCVVECNDVCTQKFDNFSLDKEFIDWHYIDEIKKSCKNCIAVNICGGPCMIENKICNNSINIEKCKFYKSMVPWVLVK